MNHDTETTEANAVTAEQCATASGARHISRRTFITVASAGAVGIGLGATGLTHLLTTRGQSVSGAGSRGDRDRTLVIIEMAGGNDGMSMVVPYANPTYYRLRPNSAIPAEHVLRLDNNVGLHPELKQLHQRGVAVVTGVGIPNPDLSHFEMLRRLWEGNFDGKTLGTTGVFGRLCDQLGDEHDPLVGVSLGTGPSPALTSERTITASLDYNNPQFPIPDDDDIKAAWQAGYRAMAHPDRSETATMMAARKGAADALSLAEVVDHLGPSSATYSKDNDLAAQLRFAARLISARIGVRVIHVPMSADFDTHEKHTARVAANMRLLDDGLGAFLTDLDQRKLSDKVLVMTTSEFGRRVAENGGPGDAGTDHGAASTLLLAGAVRAGVYGEYPSLDKLDDDGNLRFSVAYSDYLAIAVEAWFGVNAGDVLPGSPRPVAEIV